VQNREVISSFIEKVRLNSTRLSIPEFVIFLEKSKVVAENPNILERIISILKTYSSKEKVKIQNLSARQKQIYNLIGDNLSSQEIAVHLDISIGTVATHRKNIIIKGSGQLQRHSFLYGTSSSVRVIAPKRS